METRRAVICLFLIAVPVTANLFDKGGSFCCNPPKTFDGKIERILDFNDPDGDGTMTPKDLDRDLILYDINGDCQVSPYEWVTVWSCRYGDTPDKAFQIFNIIARGSDVISFEALRVNAANSTRAEFKEMVKTNLYPEVTSGSTQQG